MILSDDFHTSNIYRIDWLAFFHIKDLSSRLAIAESLDCADISPFTRLFDVKKNYLGFILVRHHLCCTLTHLLQVKSSVTSNTQLFWACCFEL